MKTPTLYCNDGSEIELPSKWTICRHCQGEGTSTATRVSPKNAEDAIDELPSAY